MKFLITSLASLAIFASGLTTANAATILLDDNFDSYANTAAFQAVWPVVGTLPSGTVSTAQSVSAPNSINNVGTTVATAAERNKRSFTESGVPSPTNTVVFSLDFYDSGTGLTPIAGNPQRNHSNLQDSEAPGSYGQLIALGLNNNLFANQDGGNYYMARLLGHTPTFLPAIGLPANPAATPSAFFKLNDVGAPLRSTGWHNLEVQISDTAFSFFVDGILSKTIAQAGTLRSYDHIRLGSGVSNGGQTVYWDNVRVETRIPEPSTLALMALGLVGIVAGGRRRVA